DGVRRVYPQRDALGIYAAEREELDARVARQLERTVVSLLRACGVGREQQIRSARVEGELAPRLLARAGAKALHVRSTRQHARSRSRPARQRGDERLRDRFENVDERP